MKTIYFSSICILSMLLCTNKSFSQDSIKYSERPNGHNSPYRIPIKEILESPDVYEGTHLQVVGYLHLDWEADAIYLKKSDLKNRYYSRGLWVHLNQFKFKQAAKLKDKYVVIDAVFDANDHGHENLWGGALKNVTALKPYRKFHR
ncbi:MAG: hypothetical protein JWR02_2538 [Mucilaginibacter sp.]|nr:hypothetical protein [Mucilaginibacter sp.]